MDRIWCRHDLKPNSTKTYKLSDGEDLERKFWDAIGLYLDTAETSLMPRCDARTRR